MTRANAATLETGPSAGPLLTRAPARLLLAAIALALALQAGLVFLQPVNWDEFRFLADVHLYRRGELSAWLQTLHVQLFFWLVDVPGNEIEQIVAARSVMLLIELGTVTLIYRCGRAFMPIQPALFAVLCYLTCSYVLRHGASFRYDPISVFLLMSALTLLLERRATHLKTAAAGALAAAAGLVTIKSVFFLPTLAAAAWWPVRAKGHIGALANRFMVGGAAAVASFAALAFLHQLSLSAPDMATGQRIVGHSFQKMIAEAGLLPRSGELARSLISDPFLWLFTIAGFGVVLRDRELSKPCLFVLLGFAAPLLTLLFYRNAFPYYYTLVFAPACLIAGYAAARLDQPKLYPVMAIALSAMAVTHAALAVSPALAVQRAHIEVVHLLFPRPVPYIDRSSMISSFPKAGFFMSSWGMENYLAAGRPLMREILLDEAPVFLLANSPALADALTGSTTSSYQLLDEDAALLRENYILHWGALWVAGKRLRASPAAVAFEILIPGEYTIEAAGPIALDGIGHVPGGVIRLARGSYRIESPMGRQIVTLRYGRRLRVPAAPPPPGPIFATL